MRQSNGDAVVVGGGPAGLTAALALAKAGHPVTMIDPTPDARPPAGRTTAIMSPQATLLHELGAWPGPEARARLAGLRIVNQPNVGPVTDVLFRAEELGEPCFGWNVANAALVDRLAAAVQDRVTVVAATVADMQRRHGGWTLTLNDGRTLAAGLVVGADGKRSPVRQALRIKVRTHDYGQLVNTAMLHHDGPAGDVSVEVHKPGGPFTTVPAAAHRSSLVWLETAGVAREIADLDDQDFALAVEAESAGRLGTVTQVEGRGLVPVIGLLAERLTAPGALILGEAAHAVSPLGAQGFNLTLRDCRVLFELARGTSSVAELARADALKAYERERLAETRAIFWLIDALNRAVLRPEAALGFVRGVGLRVVGGLAPLRRQLMQRLLASSPLAAA